MEHGGGMPLSGTASSRPTDCELAALSEAVYDPNIESVGRWRRVPDVDLPRRISSSMLEDKKSGFRAAIYTNGEEHVLAFAGTKGIRDVVEDIRQGLGATSDQYTQAEKLSRLASYSYSGKITLTGHSLGGGLASLGAVVGKVPAVTFNAAGVHRKTYERAGFNAEQARHASADGLVRAVSIKGEFLTSTQDRTPLPTASGARVIVEPAERPSGLASRIPLGGLLRSFKNHRMGAMMVAMEKDPRFSETNRGLATTMQNRASEFLKQSGMSERSVGLVTDALARKIENEAAAGRFPPKTSSNNLGRSR